MREGTNNRRGSVVSRVVRVINIKVGPKSIGYLREQAVRAESSQMTDIRPRLPRRVFTAGLF